MKKRKKYVFSLCCILIGMFWLTSCGKFGKNGKILFTTELIISDYCRGDFIVQQPTGLQYGVIDKKNKTIIPTEYDEIEFLNKEMVSEGLENQVFILAKDKKQQKIFNEKGEEIARGELEDLISYIDYDKKSYGLPAEASVTFMISKKSEGMFEFYSQSGNLIKSVGMKEIYGDRYGDMSKLPIMYSIGANKDFVLITFSCNDVDVDTWDYFVCLIDKNANIIKKWDGICGQGPYDAPSLMKYGHEPNFFWTVIADSNEQTNRLITIDNSGNLSELGECESVIELNEVMEKNQIETDRTGSDGQNYNYLRMIGKNDEYKIWSNYEDEWMFEDLEGRAVYDEKYDSFGSGDHVYFLSNKNSQVCAITENGKKTIDYGQIEVDADGNYFFDKMRLEKNIFSDYESICIVKRENDKSKVYYFSSANE